MKKIVLILCLLLAPLYAIAQSTKNNDDVSDDKKIIVAASGGYALRLEKVPSGFLGERREHMKKLNWGYTYQASAYYMFNYRAGIGVEYNAYRSSDTMPGVYEVTAPNGESGTSKISDDVTISFYGAGLFLNLFQESRQKLYFNASFGYLRYKDEAYFLGNYKVTGGGLGTSIGLTYQYLIAKDFSVGPKIGFSGSSVRRLTTDGPGGFTEKVKYSTDDAKHYTRLDVNVQLMYRF